MTSFSTEDPRIVSARQLFNKAMSDGLQRTRPEIVRLAEACATAEGITGFTGATGNEGGWKIAQPIIDILGRHCPNLAYEPPPEIVEKPEDET